VQTPTDSAVAIAASYAAKVFGIKTGTLVRDARRLCPTVIPVQANHRLYTDYHERILKAVDTCLPVEKVCSIDEMACRAISVGPTPSALNRGGIPALAPMLLVSPIVFALGFLPWQCPHAGVRASSRVRRSRWSRSP
jgi:nucleotidyltransferase/DNA polymerase involved in DNA repair